MNNFENLVVAAALDRRDATTMRHAARMAHAFHAKTVSVVHVEPPLDWAHQVVTGAGPLPTTQRPVEERLHRCVEDARGSFPVSASVQAAVRYGARVPELLKVCADQQADLLILGRRPRDEHDAISDAVVKLEWKSPCSVLIVPEESTASCERVLVACDFSEHSREALETAAALVRATPHGSLIIQHVYSLPAAPLMAGRTVAEMSAAIRDEAQRRWSEFATNLSLNDVRYTLRLDEADNVPQAITRAAVEADAQLIVVGSHGLSPRAGALLGHVADAVCARTARPFLCVKRKGEVVGLLQALLGIFQR